MRAVAGWKTVGAVAALTAIAGAAVVDTSWAHKQTTTTRIRFVPSSAPDSSGQYELHVRSRNRACYRRVPVQVIQDGRIVYAARTSANGVAPSLHTGGPRLFGPEFAGSRAVVRTRTLRRSGGHVHRCGGARTSFPAASG